MLIRSGSVAMVGPAMAEIPAIGAFLPETVVPKIASRDPV